MCGPQHMLETLSIVLCCFFQLSFFQDGGLKYQLLALFSQAGGLEYQLCICFPGWRLGVSTFHFSHRLCARSINFPFFLGWRLGISIFNLFSLAGCSEYQLSIFPWAGGSEYQPLALFYQVGCSEYQLCICSPGSEYQFLALFPRLDARSTGPVWQTTLDTYAQGREKKRPST